MRKIFVQLSQLAESLIIATRDWLYHQACAEIGTPMDEQGNPQQLYILEWEQKLGWLLNQILPQIFDRIFTYPSQGETSVENTNARRSQDVIRNFSHV